LTLAFAGAILACVQTIPSGTQVTGDTALANRVGLFVGYLMQTCGKDVIQLAADFEVSFSQMKALHVLHEHDEPTSVKALGDRLGLSMAAISRAADDLVQRGLVDRIEDPDDRRIKRLSLTPTGRDFVRRLIEARLAGLEEFVATLSDDERARLDAAIAPILARPEVAAYGERMTK
jgi:DNA-binding MarR family transcriptional regulator